MDSMDFRDFTDDGLDFSEIENSDPKELEKEIIEGYYSHVEEMLEDMDEEGEEELSLDLLNKIALLGLSTSDILITDEQGISSFDGIHKMPRNYAQVDKEKLLKYEFEYNLEGIASELKIEIDESIFGNTGKYSTGGFDQFVEFLKSKVNFSSEDLQAENVKSFLEEMYKSVRVMEARATNSSNN